MGCEDTTPEPKLYLQMQFQEDYRGMPRSEFMKVIKLTGSEQDLSIDQKQTKDV